ncbi:MAG: APC family permease [bacterium]
MSSEKTSQDSKVKHHQFQFSPKRTLKSLLVGKPISNAEGQHQRIGKIVGLAVFASDALSSTAYATQEIMVILAAAGMAALGITFPISIAIIALLVIVSISYRQTILAYPGGGGAYIVARDNLGEMPAQTAGAALLTDYILTVAVSISSGTAQLISAFPGLYDYRVYIAVAMILFVGLMNLRGVKESGTIFAIPTYFFISMMFLTVGMGLYQYFTGALAQVTDPPLLQHAETTMAVSLFLILHAFSSGTAALTGVEAISNGITAFKKPESKNAATTLIWMSAILGSLFLSISFLAQKITAIPSEEETVISQLARTIFAGRGFLYLAVIGATMLILFMAANTAFADFPRLSALHAGDGFLPRILTYKGSRLVFSRGIVTLTIISSILVIVFQASVTKLIPLYAIGVFLSFSLSQTGMAVRWWKSSKLKPGEEVVEPGSILKHDKFWIPKMIINGFGALLCLVVMIIFSYTKFKDGAWFVIILTPTLVTIFFAIHRHYKDLAKRLSLENFEEPPPIKNNRVIIPIGGVHKGTLNALRFARTISKDITVVYVGTDEEGIAKVKDKWKKYGKDDKLVIIDSPYRLLLEPMLHYIEHEQKQLVPNDAITVVVPQFIPKKAWHNLLHTQTAMFLKMKLRTKKGVYVTDTPYHV